MEMDSELQKFLERLAETLEVPVLAPEDDFRATPLWSSLAGFSVLVMIETEYGRALTAADLQSAHTVMDLARKAGVVK